MNKVLPEDSKSIAWLRFPLAAIVIYLHSMNVEFTPIDIIKDWNTVSYDLCVYNTIRILISRVLGHLAVPTFMFISGYLFFIQMDNWSWNIFLKKIKSRIYTLIIPYFLWLIIPVFINIIWLHKPSLIHEYVSNIWDKGLWDIFTAPLNSVLWFLRDLIVLVFISPVIFFILNRTRWVVFIVLYVLGLIVENTLINSAFWFSLGGMFCLSNFSITQFAKNVGQIALWGFVILGVFKLVLYNDYMNDSVMEFSYNFISNSSIILGVFLIFFITTTEVCQKVKFPIWITSASFLIYVLHMEVLWRIRWMMKMFAGDLSNNNTYQFFVYLIAPLFSLVILIFLNFILRKFTPRINYILTASR